MMSIHFLTRRRRQLGRSRAQNLRHLQVVVYLLLAGARPPLDGAAIGAERHNVVHARLAVANEEELRQILLRRTRDLARQCALEDTTIELYHVNSSSTNSARLPARASIWPRSPAAQFV